MPRSDFLRNEDDDATRGRCEARAKSSDRAGSFGWEIVEDVVSVGKPRNCDARSWYCDRRLFSVSWSVVDALITLSVVSWDGIGKPTINLLLLATALVPL